MQKLDLSALKNSMMPEFKQVSYKVESNMMTPKVKKQIEKYNQAILPSPVVGFTMFDCFVEKKFSIAKKKYSNAII